MTHIVMEGVMNEVDYRLCLVLIQKIYEVDAMDLGKVREYIKEILAILGGNA